MSRKQSKIFGIMTARPSLMALLVILASFGSLAFAYVSQYGFDMHPCILCLYQRIPYYVAFGLGCLAMLLRRQPEMMRVVIGLAGIAFLTTSAIAVFHMGVEYGWWTGTESCGTEGMLARGLDDLRAFINDAPVTRCDEPAFIFMGLSMAGWNAIWAASFGLFVVFYTLSSGFWKNVESQSDTTTLRG